MLVTSGATCRDVESTSEAGAIFKLHDWVVIGSHTRMRGFGQYRMRFQKDGGRWRIHRMDLRYRYREDHAVFMNAVLVRETTRPGVSGSPNLTCLKRRMRSSRQNSGRCEEKTDMVQFAEPSALMQDVCPEPRSTGTEPSVYEYA